MPPLADGAYPRLMPREQKTTRKQDAYFSIDVETDGPVPGHYSMLEIGVVYVGRSDGVTFVEAEREETFTATLRPMGDRFDPEALGVNGLDRNALASTGRHPAEVMDALADWVRSVASDDEPVMVAYPLSFDWMWVAWYFATFGTKGSPFRHSSAFDLKTAIALLGQLPIAETTRKNWPAEIATNLPLTHRALDDARSQADVFVHVMRQTGAAALAGHRP